MRERSADLHVLRGGIGSDASRVEVAFRIRQQNPNRCLGIEARAGQKRSIAGLWAANDLDGFIASRPVICLPISLDRYGRTVATCSVDGADIGEWLVQNGLALDWPQGSKGRYDAAQRNAERAGRGIWKGSYVEPWLYRVCVRASGSPANCSDDANAHP